MMTTNTKTSCDLDHDDRNVSDHDCVSCHSYHLQAVDVIMPKYVVVIMPLMMGNHKDSTINDKL
jgi:hypothetical protein